MSSRRLVAAAAASALVLLLSGCAGAAEAPAAPTAVVPAPTASQTASAFSAGGLQNPRAVDESASIASPVRLTIPSIGVDTALEILGIDADGRLDAPVDFDLAGWFAQGVIPGAVGPAIIAGHVDSVTAPAVFARLGELTSGAEIVVARADGSQVRFTVTGSAQSAKSNFPTSEVYSNVPTPQLRLITCAGTFDPSIGHYDDNLIVFASLAE